MPKAPAERRRTAEWSRSARAGRRRCCRPRCLHRRRRRRPCSRATSRRRKPEASWSLSSHRRTPSASAACPAQWRVTAKLRALRRSRRTLAAAAAGGLRHNVHGLLCVCRPRRLARRRRRQRRRRVCHLRVNAHGASGARMGACVRGTVAPCPPTPHVCSWKPNRLNRCCVSNGASAAALSPMAARMSVCGCVCCPSLVC